MCQAHHLALWCSLIMFCATTLSPTATLPTATFQTHFFPKLHLFHIQTLFSFLTTNKWFSNKQLVLRRVSWKWHWHNFTMVSSGNLSRQWDIWEWCSRGKRRGAHYSCSLLLQASRADAADHLVRRFRHRPSSRRPLRRHSLDPPHRRKHLDAGNENRTHDLPTWD